MYIRYNKGMADTGKKKYTAEELKAMDPAVLAGIILVLQDQIEALNANFEKLIEQMRIANQNRFGRHTEKLDVIDGQLSLFDEAENAADKKDDKRNGDQISNHGRGNGHRVGQPSGNTEWQTAAKLDYRHHGDKKRQYNVF